MCESFFIFLACKRKKPRANSTILHVNLHVLQDFNELSLKQITIPLFSQKKTGLNLSVFSLLREQIPSADESVALPERGEQKRLLTVFGLHTKTRGHY